MSRVDGHYLAMTPNVDCDCKFNTLTLTFGFYNEEEYQRTPQTLQNLALNGQQYGREN